MSPNPPHDLPPLCTACGYDLTGLADGSVCPECGAKVRLDCAVLKLRPSRTVGVEATIGALLGIVAVFSVLKHGLTGWVPLQLLLCGTYAAASLHKFRRQRQISQIVADHEGLHWVHHGGRTEHVPWSKAGEVKFLPAFGYLLVGPLISLRRAKIETSRTDGRESMERFCRAAQQYREQWKSAQARSGHA